MSRTTKLKETEGVVDFGQAKGELLLVKTRKNPEARANLATAILEDAASRQASQENSAKYLNRAEEERSRMPEWLWNVAWFILGMLSMISLDSLIWQLPIK